MIHIFSRQSSVPLWTYRLGSGNFLDSLSISADGNTIAAVSFDGHLYVFGRNSNATLWTYYFPSHATAVAVSRDGTTIAAGDYVGDFDVFNRASNMSLLSSSGNTEFYNDIAISSNGSIIAAGNANGANSRAYLFSKTLGLLWSCNVPNSIFSSYGHAAAISGDGSLAAYGCVDGTLCVFQYDLVPPVLGVPSVSPSNPVGGQTVTISVSATDNIAVSKVTLHCWNTTTSTWSSVAMSLTGAAYKVTFGPFSAGDVISYYVTANDTSGNSASSPSDAPLSYYTFLVGSPSTGASAPPSESVTDVFLGVAVGAVIVMVATLVARGKKSRS
jgi:WD40 repeat protein